MKTTIAATLAAATLGAGLLAVPAFAAPTQQTAAPLVLVSGWANRVQGDQDGYGYRGYGYGYRSYGYDARPGSYDDGYYDEDVRGAPMGYSRDRASY